MEKSICEFCNGKGEILQTTESKSRTVSLQCIICRGKGTVTYNTKRRNSLDLSHYKDKNIGSYGYVNYTLIFR